MAVVPPDPVVVVEVVEDAEGSSGLGALVRLVWPMWPLVPLASKSQLLTVLLRSEGERGVVRSQREWRWHGARRDGGAGARPAALLHRGRAQVRAV